MMAAVAEKEAKAERIEIRVTPNAKALLSAAASARHTSISEFILSHAIVAAEKAVSAPRVFFADETVWGEIQHLLEGEDQHPDEATMRWLKEAPKAK